MPPVPRTPPLLPAPDPGTLDLAAVRALQQDLDNALVWLREGSSAPFAWGALQPLTRAFAAAVGREGTRLGLAKAERALVSLRAARELAQVARLDQARNQLPTASSPRVPHAPRSSLALVARLREPSIPAAEALVANLLVVVGALHDGAAPQAAMALAHAATLAYVRHLRLALSEPGLERALAAARRALHAAVARPR